MQDEHAAEAIPYVCLDMNVRHKLWEAHNEVNGSQDNLLVDELFDPFRLVFVRLHKSNCDYGHRTLHKTNQ